jgi:hypothetical protein
MVETVKEDEPLVEVLLSLLRLGGYGPMETRKIFSEWVFLGTLLVAAPDKQENRGDYSKYSHRRILCEAEHARDVLIPLETAIARWRGRPFSIA